MKKFQKKTIWTITSRRFLASVLIITDVDVRRAAMDLLARREHGAQELQQKLHKRFSKAERSQEQDPEALPLGERIEMVVNRLAEEGLQSDARLAEAFIRARANRGQGPVKIKMELRQKGISDGLISEAMAEADQDWFALAAQVAEKKFREVPREPKEKAKRSRFLQQRGFSFDHISAVDDV